MKSTADSGFKKLYRFYKDELSNQFDCLITEVASVNTRSLHAHQAMKFRTLKKYQEQDLTEHIMLLGLGKKKPRNVARFSIFFAIILVN